MNSPLRESTSFKRVLGILISIGMVVSGALFADDRYAKSQDLKAFIISSQRQTALATNVLRKQLLEDKVYDLDLIPDTKKTDVQRAQANRAKSQLQDVQATINTTRQEGSQ